MKFYQTCPATSVRRNRYLTQIPAQWLEAGKAWGLLLLVLAACLWYAPNAAGVTATNTWLGAGSDTYWNDGVNWNAAGVPIPTSLVVFTNFGATGLPGTNGSGAVGTANIAVTNDTTIGQLWFVNTNSVTTGPQQYHTIGLDPGVTLTVSNLPAGPNSPNIIQVCSQGGYTTQFGVQNGLVDQVDYATIQGGAGSRLLVICTNPAPTIYGQANIFVAQGSAGLAAYPTIDPCNSYLDLSGLDYFEGYLNHICVAADPQSSALGYYFHRAAGTMYLAKTNKIVLWNVGNAPSGGPSSGTPGIMLGWTAQNNAGGLGRVGALYLGITNEIYCNKGIGVGGRNSSGWMGFNPSNAPGISVAYFRNQVGTGRQNLWAIGHRMNVAASGAGIQGILDLSGGMVDAMVDQLQIGRANNALATWGSMYMGAGTVDANALQLGYQEASGAYAGQGTLIVSNSAVLKINTSAVLGFITGSPVASQAYFGNLSILNGGTVAANAAPFTCGVGSSNSISVVNGSSLAVASIGTAAAPLTYLTVWNNSTLTVDMGVNGNPSLAPVRVSTLDSAGTNTINVAGYALQVGQFPLIKYTTWLHDGSQAPAINFALGSVSPGKTMYISNNVANSSIDIVVTSSDIALLTWDGLTNGVPIGNWDVNITPNWKGGNKYLMGDPVVFDDTASGTTTVTLMTDMAPISVSVNNSAKAYTLSGGTITLGPFVKDGPGLLTLANSNSSSGAFTINNGTARLSGADNRLSQSAPVTLANVATAGIDLNNLNQTLSSLNGGGPAGGNVALGTGTLRISGSGTYAGQISGSGQLIKTTGGTETLQAASTYTGGTIVSNGTLVVANSTGSGLGSGQVFVAGGTLQLGDGVNDGNIPVATITNNGTLALKPASSIVFTKVLYGTGGLSKVDQGAATPAVQITNANFYTGQSSVNNGLLQINHPRALGTGLIALGNQLTTLDELDLSGSITLSNNISIPGRTGGVVPSPAALVSINDPFTGAPGTNTLRGTNTLTGSTCFSLGSASGNGLIVAGPIVNSSSAGTRFFLRGGGYGELRSGLSGSISLEQSDDGGTWLLSGTNTYTGATLIGNNGALIVNGAIKGSSSLVVGSGAVLAGNGLISCSVRNEGTVSPAGDGVIGTLTVSNSFFSDAGTALNFDVSPTGNDQIRGITTNTNGGSLNINVLAPITGNCIFKLFDAATYDATYGYDAVNLPDISPLGWDTSYLTVDGTLHVTNGPTITPAITSITTGPGGTITISGTGTLVAPFTVLTTTNVTTPLANWQVIGTGTFSNGSFNFTDTSATNSPRRFYQVTTPVP